MTKEQFKKELHALIDLHYKVGKDEAEEYMNFNTIDLEFLSMELIGAW